MQKRDLKKPLPLNDKQFIQLLDEYIDWSNNYIFKKNEIPFSAFAYAITTQKSGKKNLSFEKLFDSFELHKEDISLFSGWSYLGFILYANKENLSNFQLNAFLDEIDRIVLPLINFQPTNEKIKQLNYINGYCGAGRYLIKEWERTGNKVINKKIKAICKKCIDILYEVMDKACELTECEFEVDFSYSHGICGLCSFLCISYNHGILVKQHTECLYDILDFLIFELEEAYKNNKYLSLIRYSNYSSKSYMRNVFPWSWCRGLGGIYYSLFSILKIVNDTATQTRAFKLFLSQLESLNLMTDFISTVPCHGLSGLLLVLDAISKMYSSKSEILEGYIEEIIHTIYSYYDKDGNFFMEKVIQSNKIENCLDFYSPLTSHQSVIVALYSYYINDNTYLEMLGLC